MCLLPANVYEAVLSGDPYHSGTVDTKAGRFGPVRNDLMVIPAAEKAGWSVSFRNRCWHNAASFIRGQTHVWTTGWTWQSAELEDGRFERITPCGNDERGLLKALGLDTNTEPAP